MNKIILLSFFALSPFLSFSQSIFWSVDFANGIPAGWTKENQNGTANWQHVPTEGSEVLFSTAPDFDSPSAANGFIQVFPGQDSLSSLQNIKLTTDAIDCSFIPTVIVAFHSSYAYFSTPNGAQLGVSTDGINFTYHDIHPNQTGNTFNTSELISVDISDQAAEESIIYLQFRYQGNSIADSSGDYYWKIDDINLWDGIVPIHDIAISKKRIPFDYQSPLKHAQPISFQAEISNRGNQTASNVNLNARIENASGTIVHSEDFFINNFPAGSDSTINFNSSFTSENIDNYSIIYELTSNETDILPEDNMLSSDFIVGTSTFAKSPGTTNFGNQNTGDYEVGNYYIINETGFWADSVFFSALSFPEVLAGKEAIITLYRLEENSDEEFSGSDIIPIGYGSHTFTETTTENAAAALYDNNTNLAGIELDTGGYIITLAYTGNSNVVSFGYSTAYSPDYQTFAVAKSNGMWSWGFGDIIPDIQLKISNPTTTSTHQHTNTTTQHISIYPNPTKNVLHFQIDNSKEDLVHYTISNSLGQVLRENQAYTNQSISLNISSYPAGLYFLNVLYNGEMVSQSFMISL